MPSDKEILSLAGMLSHQPLTSETYKLPLFTDGIASEAERLGSKPYLVYIHQRCNDYEGLMEFSFLHDSFETLPKATAGAVAAIYRVIIARTAANWHLKSEDEMASENEPPKREPGHNPLRRHYFKAIRMRDVPVGQGTYNWEDVCASVIGTFTGPIVGKELFNFLDSPSELRHYFEECGGASYSGKPRPFPEMFK